jgi:predicted AlkP superfamily phosphohydrolase/phosphomutase
VKACATLFLCAVAAAQQTVDVAREVERGAGRAIVIGVDGFDHAVCTEMIAAGDLPALKALAEEGSFIPLIPTNPAQSPVSWATLTTGRNPGSTGVNDFLRAVPLAPEGIAAELALTRKVGTCGIEVKPVGPALILLGIAAALAIVFWARGRRRKAVITAAVGLALLAALPWVLGRVRDVTAKIPSPPLNARRGDAFWDRLDRAGVPTMSLLAPMAFPAPELQHGHLLCGLGVPDVMGTPGTVTIYREEAIPAGRSITPTGCRVRPLRDSGDGRLETVTVPGPRPDPEKPRLEVPVGVRVDRESRRIEIDVAGARASVAEGAWSPFLESKFDLPWMQSLHALTRFRTIEAGPRTVLYQEPGCFDPRRQNERIPITTPLSFGAELCADGPFDTLGWACATNPLQDEVIGDEVFLSDIEELVKQRETLLWKSLRKPGWRSFFCVLSTPDRVQHMFWRDRDPAHPRHDAGAVARRGDPIRDSYKRIDGIVAKVRTEIARPDDLLLVVSDHGFSPWRWQVNLNRFLAEEGYLVGSGDQQERTLETSIGAGSLFPGIDWSKTRAYSLGLGKIYVNPFRVGVDGGERTRLLEEIRGKLLALRHEGAPVVRSAKLREEIYTGAHLRDSADLIIGFERAFRVSWQCTLGSLNEPVIAPNRSLWSGDHCSVDPELVPGVLFSSRKLDQDRAHVADVCPTIETQLGIAPSPEADGRALRFRPR